MFKLMEDNKSSSNYYGIDKFIEKTKKSPDEAGTFKADESGYEKLIKPNSCLSQIIQQDHEGKVLRKTKKEKDAESKKKRFYGLLLCYITAMIEKKTVEGPYLNGDPLFDDGFQFNNPKFNELWELLKQSSSMTESIMDKMVTKNGRGHMILIRFLSQLEGKMFVDWMKKFRKALGYDNEFSLLLDIEEKEKNKIYEDQFLPRMKEWSGRPDFMHPRTYEDLLHLPCILTVVEKGKMGITYPKESNKI